MAVVARFGAFTFDSGRRQLTRGDHAVHLTPKAFDLLELLYRLDSPIAFPMKSLTGSFRFLIEPVRDRRALKKDDWLL
jgi:hypothetical protein